MKRTTKLHLVGSAAFDDESLKAEIQEIAKDSGRVQTTPHARERMLQRHITLPEVLTVLREGTIYEHACQDIYGNWKCTLMRRVSGQSIKVVAALVDNGRTKVLVITTFI